MNRMRRPPGVQIGRPRLVNAALLAFWEALVRTVRSLISGSGEGEDTLEEQSIENLYH